MPITREQLREQLRRREIAPVYTLYGVETYLRDLAAKTIADLSFGKDDFRDFNDDLFSLTVPDNIVTAIAAADQLPMMAARRVVRITEVRVGATSQKDTLKEEHLERVQAFLANPSPSSVVVFIADEISGNRKVGKLLREKTVSVEFTPPNDADAEKWVRDRLSELNATMDERTLRHFISLIGPDIRRLTTETEKLATAALPEGVIDSDLVDSLVSNVREISNFDLTESMITGNKAKAIKVLEKILDDGAEPLALLGLMSYNYRQVLMVKDMMERGRDSRDVARAVPMNPRDKDKFLAAARRSKFDRIKHAVIRLAETDVAIKTSVGGSGAAGSRAQIEMLVCELSSN